MFRKFLSATPLVTKLLMCLWPTYAYDVSKILECSDAAGLVTDVHTVNQVFDSCLEHVCMAQSREKQEHVPCFSGRGVHAHYREILGQDRLPGRAGRSAKYLGGRQHHLDNVAEELQAREHAARVSWATFGRLWSRSALPRRAVCVLFSDMVGSALLSGLEALVLSPSQCQLLDSVLLMYGRKLMRGSACRKTVQEDGSVTYNACRSKQVWEYLRMVPCSMELRVRRLRWLQGLARSPELHCNVLASLFGRFPHDGPDIEAFSVHTNPLDQQCFDDIMPLSELDSGASLLEAMAGDMRRLFTDLRDEFLYVDVRELHAQFFCVHPTMKMGA